MENTAKLNTIQRKLIHEAVETLDIHATAEQVVEYIAKRHPTIGRTTVYRNLKSMSKAGKLLKICDFYGTTYYDRNSQEHYHFTCSACKRIFDVFDTGNDLSNVIEKFGKTQGFDVLACNISFTGLCWECKEVS